MRSGNVQLDKIDYLLLTHILAMKVMVSDFPEILYTNTW